MKKLVGFYRWEEVQKCPICNSQEIVTYSEHHYGLQIIQLRSCQNCKLIVQSPRLSEKSLDRFYKSDYRNKLKIRFNSKHSEKLFQRGCRRGAYICKFLDENGVKYDGNVVFEIGCSYGGILEQFRRKKCQVIGCDVSQMAVRYGISKGLSLKVGSIDVLSRLDYKADLLILSHVLEHIIDSDKFLKTVRQMIKPGGILYVEVPGIENPKVKERQNAVQLGHLMYFNLNTVRRLVERYGFSRIYGNEVVQGIYNAI